MNVPSRTTLFTTILLGLALLASLIEPNVLWAVGAADAALLGLCWWEGRRLARYPVTLERETPKRCLLDRQAQFIYGIENRGARTITMSVRQPWPATFEAESDRFTIRVEPGEIVRVGLQVVPRRRGRARVPPTSLDFGFPEGWARRRIRATPETHLAVYPDLKALNSYDVLRQHRALRQFGVHRLRTIGSGREFEQLRDYCRDDDFREVNWKATARRREPVTNVYQVERSQDLVLCLDCGRMMGNPVGAGTALDAAVGACILLAHACRRQQDRVGLVTFRDHVQLFLKPRGGSATLSRIIEELVDLAPEPVFPSYAALARALRRHQKRRSMIFLFSDLNDPQLAADLAAVSPLISRQHVFAVVSLRDPLVDRTANGPARDRRNLYRVLAARELAAERDARSRELRKAGVQVVEADADALSIKTLNAYLAIKSRQLV